MCFSATASYIATSILVPAGLYSLHLVRQSKSPIWMVAVIPFMFGLQQLVEGRLWQVLERGDSADVYILTLTFLFFSHLFWVVWVPLTGYRLESEPGRRKWMGLVFGLGVLIGLSAYLPLYFMPDSFSVEVVEHSIVYHLDLMGQYSLPLVVSRTLYAIVVLLPLLYSSHQSLNRFGALLAVSMMISLVLYEYAFISVWCFFAALLSLYVVRVVQQIYSAEMKTAEYERVQKEFTPFSR